MKLFALSLFVASLGLIGGCLDTPAYTAGERFNQIGRSMSFEQKQMNDDFDHALLLRPSGSLTIWNVYHRG